MSRAKAAAARAVVSDANHAGAAPWKSPEPIKQCFGILENRRIEPFGEPAVDGREQIAGLAHQRQYRPQNRADEHKQRLKLSVVGFYVGGDGRSSVSAQFCFSGWWCVALGDGWPNLPRKCQPKTSLLSGEIKDFAVFSVRQPDISGFVPRMAIYWE